MEQWFIEGYFDGDDVMRRLSLHPFPFRLGRQEGLELSLTQATGLSRVHAELYRDGGRLFLRDRDSTNGSFVNHKRVQGERALRHGDVIHVGNIEFRVIGQQTQSSAPNPTMTVVGMDALSSRLPTGIREMQELVDRAAVTPAYQPIVAAGDGSVQAYEVLGRGSHPDLPQGPGELFRIAESAGLEIALSEVMRVQGLLQAEGRVPGLPFFLNTHPKELKDSGRLLASLDAVQSRFPQRPLVLEIHEQGVTDLAAMKQLRADLEQRQIALAYDDFGAGQARLLELIEAPPAYLKFDMAFIRHIDRAPQAKLDMIESLLAMARRIGTLTLAEGTSRDEEAVVCRNLGFDYIQGYCYGRPGPLPD